MASPRVAHGTGAKQDRRLVPVGVVVVVYVVVGAAWVLGGGPVADRLAVLTSIPRWVVELVKGGLFVTITALVLHVLMQRRSDRLDDAAAREHHDEHRLADGENERHLQATALAGTANAVVITDPDGTIEWVNAAFETMSGFASSVAVGATPALLNSGMQEEPFYRELWDTILAGHVWRGEVVNRRSDGELYTASLTITPVFAANGEIQNFVAIHEDITERVQATRAADASRLRLQALFDHAVDAIVLTDDGGTYVDVNPAACELTGYSRSELLEMQPADLAAPDELATDIAKRYEEFVRGPGESGTFALQHKDGHVVEIEYRAVTNIQPGLHLSVLRDVTTRNQMLRAVTIAEAEFRELAENAADIVAKLRIDPDGRLQVDYVNPAATTVLGYPLARFYEDPDVLLSMLHERGDELDHAVKLMPTAAEPTRLATVQVQRADGRLIWLEAHSTLMDQSTDPVTIQLVGRDVTARFDMMQALEQAVLDQLEAAEQLRALNAMKDSFLQNVSHELRTPLTSIMGFAQLLADPRHGLSPADTRQFHTRILAGAKRLQRLLDDLLDVDRFTRGQIEPNRTPTDLTLLIERMIDDIEFGDHRVDLDLEPITMNLDAPWVERLVSNLLVNVVRHTPPETRLGIRTRATIEGVALTVDDDGPGIPEADRQRVMEPFEQGTPSATAAQPGTGLGLSLVKAVTQIHGGDLLITDSPAGGTRVTVTLAHEDTGVAVSASLPTLAGS